MSVITLSFGRSAYEGGVGAGTVVSPWVAVIILAAYNLPFFVFPVRCNPFFSNPVHFFGAYLYFELKSFFGNDGGVKRLIKIRFRKRDKIFESSRNRAPQLVDDAERAITVPNVVRDNPECDEIVNLIHIDALPSHLIVNAVNSLDPVMNVRRNSIFAHLLPDGCLDFLDVIFHLLLLDFDPTLQAVVAFRIDIHERQVLKLAAHLSHPKTVGNRCINFEGLFCYACLFLRRQILERSHIVEAICEFYHNHAQVIDHGKDHFSKTFGLLLFLRTEFCAADFCDSVHHMGNLFAKIFLDLFNRGCTVFHNIVEQSNHNRAGIQFHVAKDRSNFKGMNQIRFARLSQMLFVRHGGVNISLADQVGIGRFLILFDLFDDVFYTDHEGYTEILGIRSDTVKLRWTTRSQSLTQNYFNNLKSHI